MDSKTIINVNQMPCNTFDPNQIIQEENENYSQHDQSISKEEHRQKIATLPQFILKKDSIESDNSMCVNKNEDNHQLRIERSRTISSKNSFY